MLSSSSSQLVSRSRRIQCLRARFDNSSRCQAILTLGLFVVITVVSVIGMKSSNDLQDANQDINYYQLFAPPNLHLEKKVSIMNSWFDNSQRIPKKTPFESPNAETHDIGTFAWNKYLEMLDSELPFNRTGKSRYCIEYRNVIGSNDRDQKPDDDYLHLNSFLFESELRLAEQNGIECSRTISSLSKHELDVSFEHKYFDAPFLQNQVTLIVVGQIDVKSLLERWVTDPVIFIVSDSNDGVSRQLMEYSHVISRRKQSLICIRLSTSLHAHVSYAAMVNIAMDLSKSRFVMVLDDAALPSANADKFITSKVLHEFSSRNFVAVMSSMFVPSVCAKDTALPETFQELSEFSLLCPNISVGFKDLSIFERWFELSQAAATMKLELGYFGNLTRGGLIFSKIHLDGSSVYFNEAIVTFDDFLSYSKLLFDRFHWKFSIIDQHFLLTVGDVAQTVKVPSDFDEKCLEDFDSSESSHRWNYLSLKMSSAKQRKQSYCIRWCPDTESPNSLEETYPEQDFNLNDQFVYEPQHQHKAEARLRAKCCHFITADSLETLYDSRRIDLHPQNAITIVTFGSFERIDHFLTLSRKWRGPVVVVFYGVDYNDDLNEITVEQQKEIIKERLFMERPSETLALSYVSRYDIDKKTLSDFNSFTFTSKKTVYKLPYLPINTLRNIVLDLAQTRFVLPLDMDLTPDPYLREHLRRVMPYILKMDKTAIVIPHFEHRRCKNASLNILPETSLELVDQLKRGRVRPFHAELIYWPFNVSNQLFDSDCPKKEKEIWPDLLGAQKLTRYKHWVDVAESNVRATNVTYKLNDQVLQSNMDRTLWEPYVLLDKVHSSGSLLRYNEVFVGRFFNKVSFISALRALGYKFEVLYDHFLMHQKHDESPYTQHLDHLFDPMLDALNALEDEIRADPGGIRQRRYWNKAFVPGSLGPVSSHSVSFHLIGLGLIAVSIPVTYLLKNLFSSQTSRLIRKKLT